MAVVPDFVANAGAAGGLTLCLAGQAPLDPETIYRVIGDRIAEATARVLTRARDEGQEPRALAVAEAEAYLESQEAVSGFHEARGRGLKGFVNSFSKAIGL